MEDKPLDPTHSGPPDKLPSPGNVQPKSNSGSVVALVIVGVLGLGLCMCILACGLPFAFGAREAAKKMQSSNNLKQIGLAMLNYETAHETFPPAYIADEDGRPMTSWRTLILPYLEQQPLYEDYHFDKPWNDPANASLGEVDMPLFQSPRDSGNGLPGRTNYVAITGDNTAMPGEGAASIFHIRDGTSNTILVVEILNSDIRWADPRDLHFDNFRRVSEGADRNAPNVLAGDALAVFADGSIHELPRDMPRETLNLLIQRNDGQVLPSWEESR